MRKILDLLYLMIVVMRTDFFLRRLSLRAFTNALEEVNSGISTHIDVNDLPLREYLCSIGIMNKLYEGGRVGDRRRKPHKYESRLDRNEYEKGLAWDGVSRPIGVMIYMKQR